MSEMTPTEAVNLLITAGWSESRLAREVGTSQPTIHRIKHGHQRAAFGTCAALIRLASKAQADVPGGEADHAA